MWEMELCFQMFSLGHKSLRSLRGNKEGEIGEGNERVRNSRREGYWEGRNNMRKTWLVTIQNSSLVTTHEEPNSSTHCQLLSPQLSWPSTPVNIYFLPLWQLWFWFVCWRSTWFALLSTAVLLGLPWPSCLYGFLKVSPSTLGCSHPDNFDLKAHTFN